MAPQAEPLTVRLSGPSTDTRAGFRRLSRQGSKRTLTKTQLNDLIKLDMERVLSTEFIKSLK